MRPFRGLDRFPLLIIALAAFFILGAAQTPVSSQPGVWSTPLRLSSENATAWFPDIAADSTGRVHVAWAGGTVGYDLVLYTASDDGVNWTKVNDIQALAQVSGGWSTRPAFLVDRQGYLNLSFVNDTLYYSRAPAANADSANSWAPKVKISGDQVAYFSRMIQDNQGILHIFYTENQPALNCSQCYHLYYRSSADNGQTWTTRTDISQIPLGVVKPQAISDEKGDIFVVWEAGVGGGLGQLQDPTSVMFVASYNDGKTWSNPITLSPQKVEMAKDITIAKDRKGNLIVAWLAIPDNVVNYQVSSDDGRTWSDPQIIPGVFGSWTVYQSRLDDYSMAVDSSGIVHLVLVGLLSQNQAGLDLIHLNWDGTGWSKPDVIARYDGDAPEWPRIAISNGNILNTVWFVRDKANIFNSDNGHYQIFFSRLITNAPPIPTVIPTYQPLQTATAATDLLPDTIQPIPTISAPVVPTLLPNETSSSNVIYSENDYLKVLAKSLIPMVLFIVVSGIIILWRRR